MLSCAQNQISESLRLQEALERLNDAKNRSRIFDQRIRYAHEASRLLIIDAYVSGELSILCEIQALCKIDDIRRPLKSADSPSRCGFAQLILHLNSLNMPLCENWKEQPMFVSVVETVHGPDGVIPSLARLYLVNHEIEESRTGSVYVSLSKLTLYFFDGFVDGELGAATDVGGHQPLNCLQPRVIESASQIVNSIANQKSQVIKSGVLQNMFQSLCVELRVILDMNSCTVLKTGNSPFDIANVYIGPVYLGSGLSEDHDILTTEEESCEKR